MAEPSYTAGTPGAHPESIILATARGMGWLLERHDAIEERARELHRARDAGDRSVFPAVFHVDTADSSAWHAIHAGAELIMSVPATTPAEALVQLIVAATWLDTAGDFEDRERVRVEVRRIRGAVLSATTALRAHVALDVGPIGERWSTPEENALELIADPGAAGRGAPPAG